MAQSYRDALQDLVREIWKAYDKTGGLRDVGIGCEKDLYNKARGKLYEAALAIGELDNLLSKERAEMTL